VKAQKFTLLLVEDDEDQRAFLRAAFQSFATQYQIHALPNGDEAIAYLKGEGKYKDRAEYEFPSYIITDLKMAPGDGFDVLDFIKKNPALSIIPVVMLSSSDDPDDIRHAYLLGASSFLTKPAGFPALRSLLQKVHDYWAECEVPEVDAEGYAVPTMSKGKAGERFTKPTRPAI
jgi:CheY-like chemotaxis protein